jgi:hypothetical protein
VAVLNYFSLLNENNILRTYNMALILRAFSGCPGLVESRISLDYKLYSVVEHNVRVF